MTEKIIISGFGGQGVMRLGEFIASAAINAGFNTSYLPSYGAEMRGGTANCSVIITDEDVASPVIDKATVLIAMNTPSLEKFECQIADGGKLFINSSIIDKKPMRTDINTYFVPIDQLSQKAGNAKTANTVMLGAFCAVTRLFSQKIMNEVFKNIFKNKPTIIEDNKMAFALGGV